MPNQYCTLLATKTFVKKKQNKIVLVDSGGHQMPFKRETEHRNGRFFKGGNYNACNRSRTHGAAPWSGTTQRSSYAGKHC